MNLFNLFAKLFLDSKDYEKGLDEAGKKGSSFSSKLGTAMKAGAKAVMAVGSAVAVTTATLVKLGKETISYGDDIDKTSQKLGLSTDAYQKWSLALQMGGAEINSFQVAVRQLTNFTSELSQGQGDALLTLQQLGVGYEEFMAMPVDAQVKAIIEGLQGMEDQTDKTRLAQELFGSRAYQELMPILNQEKGSLDELFQSVEDLGLIMSEDAVKSSASLNDAMTILDTKFTLVKAGIVQDLFPAFEMIIGGLLEIAQGSEGATEQFTKGIIQMVDKAVTILPGLLDVASNLLFDVIMALVDSLPTIVPQLGGLIEKILFTIVDLLPTLLLSAVDLIAILIDTIIKMDWAELIYQIVAILVTELPGMALTLVGSLISAIEGLLVQFGSLGLKLGVGLVNGIIDGLNNLANFTIPGLKIGSWQLWDDTNVTLFSLPKIPVPATPFADGGMFEDLLNGTMYAVAGEQGAEVVAQGRYGTGVANVEQIAEAQLLAMERYDLRSEIRRAVEGIVNGLKSGNNGSINIQSILNGIVLKIGDKEFKAYVYQVVNEVLENKGLKNLQVVGRY